MPIKREPPKDVHDKGKGLKGDAAVRAEADPRPAPPKKREEAPKGKE